MKLATLKTTLALSALGFFATSAHAVLPHEVKCANGQTVEVPDSVSDWEACLTINSKPANPSAKPGRAKFGNIELKRGAADQQQAAKYQRLAAQHKPRTPEMQKLVEKYMKTPKSQRGAFKAANPTVNASIWDYGPYAVCFYASVAGGADVVEAGEECHADWVE